MSVAPLADIRVVELAVLVQGPMAGRVLGDLGAEVIKIEPPDGDPCRGLRITFNLDTLLQSGFSVHFDMVNRNKRAITLDLHQEVATELLHRLVARSQVFLTNLRTEGLARLGADFETLRRVNPTLVYAQGTGLGDEGPWAGKPVQDTIGMAHSGFLYTVSADGATPQYVPGSLSDVISGTYLAMGVLAALHRRDLTGEAQFVSCSQLQAMLWTQIMNVGVAANLGTAFPPIERRHVFNPLFNVYRGGDGAWFCISAPSPGEWPRFCETIGRPDLLQDPRFRSLRTRAEHRTALIDLLDEVFATQPRAAWIEAFSSAGMRVGQVNRPEELAADPQVVANRYLMRTDDGDALTPRGIVSIAGYEPPCTRAPELSRDSDAVLRTVLGLSDEEITRLRTDGLVW